MIGPTGAVRVMVATKPVDFRKGAEGLAALVRETRWRRIHSPERSTCSGRSAHNKRHSTYSFRFAAIAYPWHPLFGRTLQVSPFRRGKDLTCIYTDERPDLCRELPNWMFDEGYCAGMTLGLSEIAIEGLNEFAAVLASLGTNRKRGAQSSLSKQKEKGCAEEPLSQSSSARSRARKSQPSSASGTKCGGTDRGLGGPSAGSPEGRGIDDEGRQG